MEQKTIHVKRLVHKNQNRIALDFKYDAELIAQVRQLEDARWSSGLKMWHVADTVQNLNRIEDLFKNKALLDIKLLMNDSLAGAVVKQNVLPALSTETLQKIEKFKAWMRSRRYSDGTIGTYADALNVFFRYYSNKKVFEISNEDLIAFNNDYILAKDLSASYQNQVVNAIKLFYKTIEYKSIDITAVHRPQRSKVLPNVLSKEEVKAILEAPKFLKHKAMLSLMYACGLRCGELLRLKPEHIDAERNLLLIKQSKGRKDRIVPLSDKTIELLRTYFKVFKPKIYLFEGEKSGQAYNERSLQQVLKQCIIKAKVNKPVTLHWLRHSYATHLLENGTDLRYIQEILGHSSSKTTEIYTHVSTKSIQKIKSPFDFL